MVVVVVVVVSGLTKQLCVSGNGLKKAIYSMKLL